MRNRTAATLVALAAAATATLALALGAGASSAPKLGVHWRAPTPADGAAITVTAGEPLTVELAASASQSRLVLIGKRGLPAGASLEAGYGQPGKAKLVWTPTQAQVGEHVLTFTAQTRSRPHAYARPRSLLVYVAPSTPPGEHEPFALGGPNGLSRWAYVRTRVAARARPSARARVLTHLQRATPEGTNNLVLALSGQIDERGAYWVRVRLPILPNGSTGWVPRSALGPYHANWTRLVIDRTLLSATLYRRGAAVFTTRVGVGKAFWPTPAGEFYVRERLSGFSDPIYGPLAFGTNARSNVLTDWPGGGFIGIHGTNEPEILPGHVSHGCVRMRNYAVLRLARLMPLGTPVTIN